MELHPHEVKVLKALKERKRAEEAAEDSKLEVDAVMRASSWLSTKGLVEIERKIIEEVSLGAEGKEYAEKGLPERRIINSLGDDGTFDASCVEQEEINIGLGWLKKKKIADFEKIKKRLIIRVINSEETADEKLLKLLKEKGGIVTDELTPELKEGLNLLKQRKNVIEIKERKEIFIAPTKKGLKLRAELLDEKIKPSVSQLTPQMLLSGEWKDMEFRAYDVDIFVTPKYAAKKHPLMQAIDQIRSVFLKWALPRFMDHWLSLHSGILMPYFSLRTIRQEI